MLQKIVPLFAAASDHVLIVRAKLASVGSCDEKRKHFMLTLSERAHQRARAESRYRSAIETSDASRRETLSLITRIKGEISDLEKEAEEACREYIDRQVSSRCGRSRAIDTLESYGERIGSALSRGSKMVKLNGSLRRHKRLLHSISRDVTHMKKVADGLVSRTDLLSKEASTLV